jgi:hypothetical protein
MCFFLCQKALGRSAQTDINNFTLKSNRFFIEAIDQRFAQKSFLYITFCLRKLRCLVLAEIQVYRSMTNINFKS